MVCHAPWIGTHYGESGMGAQRVAVVGYSHWLEAGCKDTDQATIDCISKVVSGRLEKKTTFFDRVRDCFGYDNHEDFWPEVMFFEFLPDCVGGGNDRYKSGTLAQRERAARRFLRLITDHKPDKVFIFTGFNARSRYFPPMDNKPESIQEFPMFKWGTYTVGDHRASAFFLRHPERASMKDLELMRKAVKHILDLPNLENSD
jgi:hypothetical protein